jgi:hypothetical protein
MKRRDSIKILMASTAGLIALPSWAEGWSASTLKHSTKFFTEEQSLLASVTETIIPAGNGPGAQTVGVDKFLVKLFENCYDTTVQENIKTQLAKLDTSAQVAHQQSFTTLNQSQREELLLKFSNAENEAEREFFKLIKSETIRGYNTSKEVMVTYLKYQQVPGHYYGCVDIKAQ